MGGLSQGRPKGSHRRRTARRSLSGTVRTNTITKVLRSHENRFTPETPLVLGGDFNVARDQRDVAHPAAWEPTVLFHPTSRLALEELLNWGLVDVLQQQYPEGEVYSWWDYRNLAFAKNNGLRIDYIFATVPMGSACTDAEIDRQERKGLKPSDHAPVLAHFSGP